MVSEHLRELFPNLDQCDETSPRDPLYNCFAWALRLDDTWVEPREYADGYWPEGVSRELKIESFVAFFSLHGFSICGNSSYEEGLEKIAVYADRNGAPTHAARQLPNGKWTSKLGALEDVTHELDALAGSDYGEVRVILKRTNPFANLVQS